MVTILASHADHGTKVIVIRNNAHKYSVSAMCEFLNVKRASVYYKVKPKKSEVELTEAIRTSFENSRKNYGTRKIKNDLAKVGLQVSRRKIARIMKREGLVSSYTKANFKPQKIACNEAKIDNVLGRKFNDQPHLNVVVSDLTYVRVNGAWNYVCLLIDLFNREIIGHSAGKHKTASLVQEAFAKVSANLENIKMFHTDRGKEFDNKLIEDILRTFRITRSPSVKGTPYDNAVAEATYKVIKVEFANHEFESLEELKLKLFDYVNWYNNHRSHSSLDYMTPVEYKEKKLWLENPTVE